MFPPPPGCTHFAEFYTDVHFYMRSYGMHYNQVIDHPTECWQRYSIWKVWDHGKWVGAGSGFSDRRLKEIKDYVVS